MNVYKRGNRFQITYRVPGYSHVFNESFLTEEEAELRAAEIELERRRNTLKPPVKREKKERLTLSLFLDIYVDQYGLSRWGRQLL